MTVWGAAKDREIQVGGEKLVIRPFLAPVIAESFVQGRRVQAARALCASFWAKRQRDGELSGGLHEHTDRRAIAGPVIRSPSK